MGRTFVSVFGSGGDYLPSVGGGGGPAELTGTPTEVIWAAGADPAAQNITIPSDCTAVYVFWVYYEGVAGSGLASMTLNGANASQSIEQVTAATDRNAAGVSVWYNPPTGVQSLNPAWDAVPVEGPSCVVVYTKNGDTTAWRDADAQCAEGNPSPLTVTVDSAVDDLVLFFDAHFNTAETPPSLPAGFTNGQTGGNNDEGFRLSFITATGATQACVCQDTRYSSGVALSIPGT